MINEDYCSREVAKLLKEKGFNELVHYEYHDMMSRPQFHKKSHNFNGNEYVNCVTEWFSAPTHQMAIKWLRDAKGVYITIVFGAYPSLKKVFWTPQIDSLEGFDLPEDFYDEYDRYEDAVEAALKYALENLF